MTACRHHRDGVCRRPGFAKRGLAVTPGTAAGPLRCGPACTGYAEPAAPPPPPPAGVVPLVVRATRCGHLGERLDDRVGCVFGCRHACDSPDPAVTGHLGGPDPLAGRLVTVPRDDCRDCPGFADTGRRF